MLLRVVCGAALGSTFQTLVKRSHNQFSDRCFATTGPTLWNSLPEQLRNRTSPSDNSNDRWKSICLVSRAPALCVWTLRALTKNLFTYLLTDLLTCFVLFPARKFPSQTWNSKHPQKCHSLSFFSLITVKLLKRGYEMVVHHCLTYTIVSRGWFLHDLVQWLGQ